MIHDVGRPHGLKPHGPCPLDIRFRIVADIKDLAGCQAEFLDELEKHRWMRFAVPEFSGDEDGGEKGSDAEIIKDLSRCRTVGEIGQQSKAILLLQRSLSIDSVPGIKWQYSRKAEKYRSTAAAILQSSGDTWNPWSARAALIQKRLWVSLPLF